MNNMNCVSTMPEVMPEITDEAIIEALFAQRPYEEKVINSAFLEIPAEYQRKLNMGIKTSLPLWFFLPHLQVAKTQRRYASQWIPM